MIGIFELAAVREIGDWAPGEFASRIGRESWGLVGDGDGTTIVGLLIIGGTTIVGLLIVG